MAKRQRHSASRNVQRDESEIPYPAVKRCSCCNETKLAADFPKASREKDGLKSNCKACASIARRDYYARNSDREIANTAVWQKANSAKKKRHARRTYLNNHESRKARNRKAYQDNKATRLQEHRVRYATDPDFRAKKLEDSSRRYAKAPQRFAEYRKQYREQNRDKLNVLANAARSRKANAPGRCTATEWQAILEEFNYHCAYCLRPDREVGKLTMDHMTPLTRGGGNDSENLVPACKSCNCSKNNRTILEYLGSLRPMRSSRATIA